MPKSLNDDRVPVKEEKSELMKNIDAIMEAQASLAKAIESIHKDMTEIKRLAKAGRF
jgi:predicted  nucleic acid-binding Zn-ribbon protein